MSDITVIGASTYEVGGIDTATILLNGVSPRRAEHVNGPASAAVQIEHILGSGTVLKGSMADLATRLTVALNSTGTLKLDGFTGLTADRGLMASNSTTLQVMNHTPIGVMMDYAGPTAPVNWLLCDGQAINRIAYAKLFAAISTTYGIGDGSTTFNVPDRRGRMSIMVDGAAGRVTSASTGGSTADTLGGSGGSQLLPEHVHQEQSMAAAGGSPAPAVTFDPSGGPMSITSVAQLTDAIATSTGVLNTLPVGQAGVTGVMNPWLAVNVIIFAGV